MPEGVARLWVTCAHVHVRAHAVPSMAGPSPAPIRARARTSADSTALAGVLCLEHQLAR